MESQALVVVGGVVLQVDGSNRKAGRQAGIEVWYVLQVDDSTR